jgi:hypothetical protein
VRETYPEHPDTKKEPKVKNRRELEELRKKEYK